MTSMPAASGLFGQNMSIQYSMTTSTGQSKLERYKWSDPGRPGKFVMLHKSIIEIPDEYQRNLNESKVSEITKNFSWAGFGVLVIVYRNGIAFVVDGQHRSRATLRRDDIDYVPCMAFEFDEITEEAKAFLNLNTLRRPLSSIERHKAEALAGDSVSVIVERAILDSGLRITKNAINAGQIKCIGYCKKLASIDPDKFRYVVRVASELSFAQQMPVQEILLKGLTYIDSHVDGGILSSRMASRLRQTGANDLLLGAKRYMHALANSGEKTIATGMMETINKGLRQKFLFSEK